MFSTKLIVRGYHCDAYGHVNNARYLEFFEECRWKFLEPFIKDKSLEHLGVQLVVFKINIHYKRPLVPNDTVSVQISEILFSKRSITFLQEIMKDGDLSSTAEVQFVLFDTKTKKSIAITDEIQSMFNDIMNKHA